MSCPPSATCTRLPHSTFSPARQGDEVEMNSPFAISATFMGVPQKREPGDAKAVVLGLPFDCGLHPHRIGSRQGPSSIRKQSLLTRPIDADTSINPLEALGVVDLGDAKVRPGEVGPSYAAIEEAMDAALAN